MKTFTQRFGRTNDPFKARATCVQNGVATSGESAFFTVPANGAVNLPVITLRSNSQIPVSLGIASATISLTAAGQTLQLTITGKYPDKTTREEVGGRRIANPPQVKQPAPQTPR